MNVRKGLIAAVLVLGGSFIGVAGDQPKPPTMGIVVRPLPKQIETQDRIIYINSRDGQPPRFTVKVKDGKVLAKNATLDELQRKDPVLASSVRRALANERKAVPPPPATTRHYYPMAQ